MLLGDADRRAQTHRMTDTEEMSSDLSIRVRHSVSLERVRLFARCPRLTTRDAAHRDALERVSRVVAPRANRADQRAFASTRGLAGCRPRLSRFFSGIASACVRQLSELSGSRGGRVTRTNRERTTATHDVDGRRG